MFLVDQISTGSTIIQVEQSEFDATAGDDGLEFKIGDEITDSIENPSVFSLGESSCNCWSRNHHNL